jgi:AcrR family transcriptional regulator
MVGQERDEMSAETPGRASRTVTTAAAGRRARKAERTRRSILDAARAQMADGGPESVTIAAITDRADIGLGTFYNYFKSRDELIDSVIFDVVEGLGRRLDALTRDMDDAAEVYSFSLRHLMHTAVSDPVWGWFVVRLGIAQEGLLSALGPRASRDIQIGVDRGRFTVTDVALASAMTFGSLLAAMHNYLDDDSAGDPSQLYAENLLRMVGIERDEAHRVANLPLPPLPDLDPEDD